MFYLLLIIGIITHISRTIYETHKYKGKITEKNSILFSLMFINMALLWTAWFNMCSFDIIRIQIFLIIKYSGLALTLLGIVLFIMSLIKIKNFDFYKGKLITTGIYKKIRHPMYLSFMLWLFGYSIFHGALISFLFAIPASVNIMYWRYLEEKMLEKEYPEYKKYRENTLF